MALTSNSLIKSSHVRPLYMSLEDLILKRQQNETVHNRSEQERQRQTETERLTVAGRHCARDLLKVTALARKAVILARWLRLALPLAPLAALSAGDATSTEVTPAGPLALARVRVARLKFSRVARTFTATSACGWIAALALTVLNARTTQCIALRPV